MTLLFGGKTKAAERGGGLKAYLPACLPTYLPTYRPTYPTDAAHPNHQTPRVQACICTVPLEVQLAPFRQQTCTPMYHHFETLALGMHKFRMTLDCSVVSEIVLSFLRRALGISTYKVSLPHFAIHTTLNDQLLSTGHAILTSYGSESAGIFHF